MKSRGNKRFAASVVGILLASHGATAQQSSSALTPVEVVRRAVQNEDKAFHDPARFMFIVRKQTLQGASTKLMLETKDTMTSLAIANDDKPLEPEERGKQIANLDRLLNNPEQLRKQTKREKEDDDRFIQLVRALPDAFLYEFAGEGLTPPGIGKVGNRLLRLTFKPNPRYNPPSEVEKVLTAVQGELLIDADSSRIAKIEGSLYKGVGFGWGILGHLNQGGHFLMEQGLVSGSHWDITRMTLAFTGKILIKHFEINSDERFTGYAPLPENLSFAQGVELLKKRENEMMENHRHSAKQD